MLQKFQRDMAERGHSLESIKASIESRKPDFDAYIGSLFYVLFLLYPNQNLSHCEFCYSFSPT